MNRWAIVLCPSWDNGKCPFQTASKAILSPLLHTQRPTDRRIAAHAPDFRVKVIMHERIASEERGEQLYGEGLLSPHDVLARRLIPEAEEDAEGYVVE